MKENTAKNDGREETLLLLSKDGKTCPKCRKENRLCTVQITNASGKIKQIKARRCSCGAKYVLPTDVINLPYNVYYLTPDGKRIQKSVKKRKQVTPKKVKAESNRDIEKKLYTGTSLERSFCIIDTKKL